MDVTIEPAGDAAWVIELPDRLEVAVNARAAAIASAVRAAGIEGLTDVVVGFRTVTVYADPLVSADLPARLSALAREAGEARADVGARLDVPVCYEGDLAPDLGDVAAFSGCTTEEVIAAHLAVEYRVFVVGFTPGFAYMAPVDPRLALPRRRVPRLKVPAGSVAIAAGQTGIYPAESPGGWHIIGRTPVKPYDSEREQPFLFAVGDHVRFRRIDMAEFRRTSRWEAA